ncbi:hypothetical protein HI850_011515 [bacterium SPL81]|nr:hypothetical protein [Acinetobacter baumannii]
MNLIQNEKILYKAKPFNSIQTTMISIILSIMCLTLFSLTSTYFAMLTFIMLLGVIRFSDYLIITNQRIILRVFLTTKCISIEQLDVPLELTIEPFTYQKYEWQRKLLGQDLQKFWQYRANIQFIENSDRKTLNQLRLSLFSKKQTDQILAILAQRWNLDPSIKQSN